MARTDKDEDGKRRTRIKSKRRISRTRRRTTATKTTIITRKQRCDDDDDANADDIVKDVNVDQ